MAKLKMLGPRIPTMDTRRVKPYFEPKQTDAHYGTAAHKHWAAAVKERDGARCQDPAHVGDRSAPDGIADHIHERRDGGADLDLRNGKWLCRSCHATKTAKAKKDRSAGPSAVFGSTHPQWMRPSKVPLVIVCGPPAAGKTTLARTYGGLLIDLDDIAQRICGRPSYACDGDMLGRALHYRNDTLGSLSHFKLQCDRAAFVVSEPTAEKREWWAQKLKPKAVVVCETPDHICLNRIANDPARAEYRGRLSQAVMAWWANYTPRRGDTIAKCH